MRPWIWIGVKIKNIDTFHDRSIIIDQALYHLGASIKDLGKKCFEIGIIKDTEYLDKILDKIKKDEKSSYL